MDSQADFTDIRAVIGVILAVSGEIHEKLGLIGS